MQRLHYKLIFILVAFSLSLVLLNLLALNWFFDRGFNKYVKQQRYEHVQRMAEELSELHTNQLAWQRITADERYWRQWLKKESKFVAASFVDGDEKKPVSSKPRMPVKHIYLCDAQKMPLFQRKLDVQKLVFVPVQVAQHTVAYLAYFERDRAFSRVEKLFFYQQMSASLLTLFMGSILSLVLAYFLAKRLLRPVAGISQVVRALASKDYIQRAQVNGDDELSHLAQDVNQLAITLDEQQQAQQRWMTDIAHELRTPLAILKAQLEALQDGVRKFDATQLAVLKKETDYLQKLVEDMRQLSLSERGSLSYRWQMLDLKKFLSESELTWRQSLKPGCHFELIFMGEEYGISADPDRLKQLLHNLLQNSLRYTEMPGNIKVCCTFQKQQILLSWEDSAPSVDQQHLPLLFERLYRVDSSRNREIQGSGIGLVICRNIVEAHQGNIVAQQSALGGVAILISLPKTIT